PIKIKSLQTSLYGYRGLPYVYLEHGAHWAIGALAIILLLSIDHRFAVPEWVTASVGVVFIGAAFTESVRRNRLTVRSPTKFGS
ncbi:DUF475 domain-containing protein, partial [Mycobacterium canettii]|uniref:DUF475 domain-containing protein n=1 Tax=Mycobacterium canetti TaxID=78331 RepID=UPI00147C676A